MSRTGFGSPEVPLLSTRVSGAPAVRGAARGERRSSGGLGEEAAVDERRAGRDRDARAARGRQRLRDRAGEDRAVERDRVRDARAEVDGDRIARVHPLVDEGRRHRAGARPQLRVGQALVPVGDGECVGVRRGGALEPVGAGLHRLRS